jgi:arginyl-tRNA---protein transferase
MPGIATLEELEKIELDHIVLKASVLGPLRETSDLVSWDTGTISQWPGIKASVAELVAALGTDCVDVLCLDFVRG